MFWIPPRKRDQYDPVFANNTWAKIIKACQNKEVPETWTVGSQKAMTINGTDYPIDIIGKNHDTYPIIGAPKAPLTFQLHDCYEDTGAMNSTATNVNSWPDCAMRETTMPNILSLMPAEVQRAIRRVYKYTKGAEEDGSGYIFPSQDLLFLLSEYEIFGKITYSGYTDGTNGSGWEGPQYDYYKAGGSKIKTRNGNASYWWERSVRDDSTTKFCAVTDVGRAAVGHANVAYGIAFAFCF